MNDEEQIAGKPARKLDSSRGEARTPKTIRFSDSEWEKIENLGIEQGISSADVVRQTMIAMTNGKFPAWFDAASLALPPAIQTQIEKMYRGMYILATLKRDEMFREGRRKEMDAVSAEARKTQEAIVKNSSKS